MQQQDFIWQRHPEAENLIIECLQKCAEANSEIRALDKALLTHTSTRLFDWLDHIAVGLTPEIEAALTKTGFQIERATHTYRVFRHPGAQLPAVVVRDHDQPYVAIAVLVDHISDFLLVRGLSRYIEGSPLSCYRRCCLSTENQVSLWIVERRGDLTMEPAFTDHTYLNQYQATYEMWATRPRFEEDEDKAMSHTLALAEEMVQILGRNLAATVVLECERHYWQARNRAAQLQKNRQDALGMGWANHDHHTFRSSRRHFPALVRLFEMLGFHCRERFYAGEEAGWGAQVMENPDCRLVLFLDVDLSPEEISIDFSHQRLPELPTLGTIGLWCALHGDSILQPGMHHLEAQFMFDSLKKDLEGCGIGMMEPFSSFPFLQQAFTVGEHWKIDPKRIDTLLDKKLITPEQAALFREQGALGSHLENLQRREGYKGFNQKNVSYIIKKTDPRLLG